MSLILIPPAACRCRSPLRSRSISLCNNPASIALTQEQCVEYELPRTPIKKSELRAANFEAQFGEGGIELDALEALHPGVLRQILVEHIERYYDADLDDEVSAAIDRFREELDCATTEVRQRHAGEIAAINQQRSSIDDRFAEVRNAAQATYNATIEPARRAYHAVLDQAQAVLDETIGEARENIMEMEQRFLAQAEPLIARMNAELEDAAPDPDLFDWPEPAEADEWDDNPLYDSTRPYIEQVDRFREHQGKDADVRFVRDRRPFTRVCTECGEPFSTATKSQTACGPVCANKRGYRVRVERKRHAGKPSPG